MGTERAIGKGEELEEKCTIIGEKLKN